MFSVGFYRQSAVMSSTPLYSSSSCFHDFTAPSLLNSYTTKLIFRSEKIEKKTVLLLIWNWLLNHKNWDKIADGTTNVWHEKFTSYPSPGVNNFTRKLFINFLFTFKLERNTNFFPNNLWIIWNGSIFQSWKLSWKF